MCSRIKSVTNQIRKINGERCEVHHKMSESEIVCGEVCYSNFKVP